MNENCVKKFTTSVSSIYVVTVTFVVELPEVITRACTTGTFCTIVVVQNVSLRMIGSWVSRRFFGYFDRKWRYLLEGSLRWAHAQPEVGDFSLLKSFPRTFFKFFSSIFSFFIYFFLFFEFFFVFFAFLFWHFFLNLKVTLHFKRRENDMFS